MATISLGGNTAITTNLAVGTEALANVSLSGTDRNVAVGYQAMQFTGLGLGVTTAVGRGALQSNITTDRNVAVGYLAAQKYPGTWITAVGAQAGTDMTSGNYDVAIGTDALGSGGTYVTGVGSRALHVNSGNYNVAIGADSMLSNTTGSWHTAVGATTLARMVSNHHCTAIGRAALENATGGNNTAVGAVSFRNPSATVGGTAVGQNSLAVTTGSFNTALGKNAMSDTTFSNCTALGVNAIVTGNNQVQLGDAATRVYAYGAVLDRSDARDKTDIRDTSLGLQFIRKLRPREFRWQLRGQDWNGTRVHQGLIAQEVKEVMEELGVDFAGYQDHVVKDGEDVLSLGYTEFIGPLIQAVHELTYRLCVLKKKIIEKKNGNTEFGC